MYFSFWSLCAVSVRKLQSSNFKILLYEFIINITDTCYDIDEGKMATDIDATKYSSVVQDSFDCYMECRNNDECNYWSYVEPTYSDGSHKTCFLKTKKDWTDSDPAIKGITSGARTKICPGFASTYLTHTLLVLVSTIE